MELLIQTKNIEQYNEVNQNLGWQLEYYQLSKKNINARIWVKESSEIFLTYEVIEGHIDVKAAPVDMVAIFVPANINNDFHINGQVVSDNTMMLLMPGGDCHASSKKISGAYIIHVPLATFQNIFLRICPNYKVPLSGQTYLLERDAREISRLRKQIKLLLETPLPSMHELFSELLEQGILVLCHNEKPQLFSTKFSNQIIITAKDYIEHHLKTGVKITELCRQTEINPRTLERIFLKEFGLTPSRYILVRRLNKARFQLLVSDPFNSNVSTIAMENGFTHLGRFSGQYFNLFGEYPKDTLFR